jgi:hypothetical protein
MAGNAPRNPRGDRARGLGLSGTASLVGMATLASRTSWSTSALVVMALFVALQLISAACRALMIVLSARALTRGRRISPESYVELVRELLSQMYR